MASPSLANAAKCAFELYKRLEASPNAQFFESRKYMARQQQKSHDNGGNQHECELIGNINHYLGFVPETAIRFDRRAEAPYTPPLRMSLNVHENNMPLAIGEEFETMFSIADQIKFIETILTRHYIEEHLRKRIRNDLATATAKRHDDRLFMGVVGQIASGKSTFINAILGDDLLRTNVLQATTAASTVIEHGRKLSAQVILQRHAGKDTTRMTPRSAFLLQRFLRLMTPPTVTFDKDDFRFFIEAVTAEEAIAEKIAHVHLTHPSPRLKGGLAIVDTPGTNATNDRHYDVTVHALKTICDVAVIVIPQEDPGPETLFSFLKENLTEVLHRCVFVITKIDLLTRPKERDRLVKFMEDRVSKELCVSSPCVLTAAPRVFLDCQMGLDPNEGRSRPLSDTNIEEHRRQFEDMMTTLTQFMHRQKPLVVVETLIQTLTQILVALDTALEPRQQEIENRRKLLQKNRLEDLEKFIREQKTLHRKRYRDVVAKKKNQFNQDLRKISDEGITAVWHIFNRIKNMPALHGLIRDGLDDVLTRYYRKAIDTAESAFRSIDTIAEAEHEKFTDAFAHVYHMMENLGAGAHLEKIPNQSFFRQINEPQLSIGSRQLSKGVNAEAIGDAMKTVSGIGSGATIGTMIMPGIGTVIGALFGGVLGWMFVDNIENTKRKHWPKIQLALHEYFERMREPLLESFENKKNKIEKMLMDIINCYHTQYAETVAEIIDKHKAELDSLKENSRAIDQDKCALKAHCDALETGLAQLRFVSSGDV